MSLLIAILLGLIQGITEFLPVSSSGHLNLISKIFGIQNDIIFISVMLHFATLFAVVFAFRKQIWEMIKHPLSKEAINLYIATIPTVLLVLFYKTCLDNFFSNQKLLPFGFLITAILLLFTFFMAGNKFQNKEKPIEKKSAFLMGFAQGFAVLPGISRSGSTICTGLLSGEKREETTKFSFILSIPIILASVVYELVTEDVSSVFSLEMITPLVFSFITAFIVGIASIKFMLKIMKNAKYYWFSIYLFAIAIVSFFII
jgi:undecaprenyl-diphosphatase